MRINNEVRKFFEAIYWIGFLVLFALAITSGSLPIQITFIIIFIIGSFINTVYNELKRQNLKPTRKNILAEMPTQLFAFVVGALILALVIYLINLWYGFIFIFLIGGFLYTFTKSFRGK